MFIVMQQFFTDHPYEYENVFSSDEEPVSSLHNYIAQLYCSQTHLAPDIPRQEERVEETELVVSECHIYWPLHTDTFYAGILDGRCNYIHILLNNAY